MPEREPKAEPLLTSDTATITPWAEIRDSLSEGGTTWLATVRPDGRPHVVPVGALWLNGAFYITTGQSTRKGKNLASNPHCVITLAAHGFDLVVEGEAARLTDNAKLQPVADAYAAQGWP